MEIQEITKGISKERLLEICEAERKNKLVILPDVNIGDTVYVPYYSVYGEHWVYPNTVDGYQVLNDNIARPCYDTIDEGLDELDEYYLTEAEAERIAKERADKVPKLERKGNSLSFEKMNDLLKSVWSKTLIEQLERPNILNK